MKYKATIVICFQSLWTLTGFKVSAVIELVDFITSRWWISLSIGLGCIMVAEIQKFTTII